MYLTLLRKGSFVFLWLAQITSTFAVQLYKIGVVVVIFEQTGSTLQAAGVLVATSLPYVLVGQLAGALVDRYPRKRMLIGVALAQALLVGVSTLLMGEVLNIWLAYVVVAGLSLTDAFYKPAMLSLLPTLVDKAALVHANSLIHSTNYAVMALGYGLGGIMILQFGLATIVAINLVLFLLAALLVTRIVVVPGLVARQARKNAEPIWRSIRSGLAYLRQHDLARSLITMEFLEHWPHAIWTAALMLAFTIEGFKVGEEFFGYQNAVYFGSNIIGAAIAVAFASRLGKRPGWVIIINALLMALLTVVYALTANIWLALLVMLLYGLPMALRDVAQDSLLQATIKGEVLGRVYATRQMLANLAFMVAGLLLAGLADLIPIRAVYLLGAGLYFLTAFYALAQASLRQAALLPAIPEPAEVAATLGGFEP
ncbi:MAG: MFS transporter [Anaerolineales bacterium]|nr:MFS transporter [Anaerolineales bacterium]